MAEAKDVRVDVTVFNGAVVMVLSSGGVGSVPINLDPQSSFELGEKLARASHEARFGQPLDSDENYLRDQIRKRTTEDYRNMMVRKVELVTTGMLREPTRWPPKKAAEEIVDIVLSRALPSA